ncbi:DUF58 domain-containing protein [Jonesia denitrificans]|uniref:DUF58 domain-containing protein n=1 Tax=Jonesia denitrificans (strain ATCC 14870 / DSM 20603 / BCRC 15368 / CIP 55.134 / JCM 11481 / NBRC 15587 / NCTC 10816 / Prevot 55134) TaxID=471856 RepID=C7R481_JONDD|nr:DUF58 domain-containing protein [Jonesia denitrificans]ACV08938.1 protein of unknown function DUF58 [Jonesia denitrificans DSM 20603]ASE09754.1 DUF58 domain-containing protein [Jonesia denitrificans]QXB44290.1 DUF58 domain-containing protein [Jonesia denitrificans]SQH21005.1 Uncharacterized conserved protein (some members contain a von Willebrand factor type A (vWA) domain) [Jonesia denitrificans]
MTNAAWYQTNTPRDFAILGVLTLAIALIFAHPLIALIACSLILIALLMRHPRPTTAPTVTTTVTTDAHPNSQHITATATITTPISADAHIRIETPGAPPITYSLRVATTEHIDITIPLARTGQRHLGTATTTLTAPHYGLISDTITTNLGHVTVLPAATPLPTVPLVARITGLTGPHTSRARGAGTEFLDLAPMQPHDRRSTINWYATARKSPDLTNLYVRRTYAQAEATIVIMIDSRDDVGREIALWGSGSQPRPDQRTSLDIARIAGLSLAHTHITRGDRVGLEDLGHPRPPLSPATGARHLARLQHALALATPHGAPPERTRAPAIPAGAQVYLLSTLLDNAAYDAALSITRHGHSLIIIDTLPTTNTWGLTPRAQQAWRIISHERSQRIAGLTDLHCPVIQWDNANPHQAFTHLDRHTQRTKRTQR